MVNIIEKAFQFALIKHQGQYRKGTRIPYITHPFAVGMILKHYQYSDEVVAAGILHDTLEDTETTEDDLLELFGKEVLELVKAASEEDTNLSWEVRKQKTIDELPSKMPDQLAIIIADKLHNIRSIKEDYNKLGEAVWDRFNRGKSKQSWYYNNIINILNLSPLKKEIPLIHLLDAEIKILFPDSDKLTD